VPRGGHPLEIQEEMGWAYDVSYSGLLINTCSIYRPTVTYTRGRPAKTYAVVATGVKCRIQWHKGGTDIQSPREQGYEAIAGYFGFFEYGANIQKDDKIIDDRNREFIITSSPIDTAGYYHHVEAALKIQE